MDHYMTSNEWEMFNHQKKVDKVYNQFRTYCPRCGHSIIMGANTEKKMCDWCKNWIFKDKRTEFEYGLKEQMKKCL